MRQFLTISLAVFLLVNSVDGDPKASICKKIKNNISGFFSEAQLSKLAGLGADIFVENDDLDVSDLEDMQSSLLSDVMGILTTDQYMTAYTLYTQAMDQFDSISDVLPIALNCYNGTQSMINPLKKKLQNQLNAASKKSNAQKKKIIFKFINNKFTVAFAKKVAKACKNTLTSAQWAQFKPLLSGVVKLSKLGLS